jgi:hypothetical protein
MINLGILSIIKKHSTVCSVHGMLSVLINSEESFSSEVNFDAILNADT